MATTNHVPVPTATSAPAGSRPALVATEPALGFLPNLFATMSGSLEPLSGYLALEAIAQAMEVAANVCLKTISNHIDGLAYVQLDEPLEPQHWEPTKGSVLAGAA
jgi:hypothetical protein